MPTSRLEAFSDAVMAIAITLMALEIDLPTSGQSGLWHGLAGQWPAFAAYAVSFFTIGTIWVNHHLLFDRMARVDRALLYLNLLLLMLVGLLPLPTALVAEYLRHGTNARAAAVLYSGALLAMGLIYSALAHYAARVQHLRTDHLTPPAAAGGDREQPRRAGRVCAGHPAGLDQRTGQPGDVWGRGHLLRPARSHAPRHPIRLTRPACSATPTRGRAWLDQPAPVAVSIQPVMSTSDGAHWGV